MRASSFIKLCSVAVTLGLFAACSQTDEQAGGRDRGERAVRVIAEPIAFENEIERIEAVGTSRATQSATIFPESSGEVSAINFSAGDFVKAGAILARLDNEAEALAVARSKVAVRDAEQLIARYQRIDVPGAISDSQVDTARTALDAAQIELDLAELALKERAIRAPFAGFVGLSSVDPGARITTNTEITRLDDRRKLYVDFSAPEEVFGGVAVSSAIPLEPFARNTGAVEGIVTAVDSRIDDVRRSFTIRAEIDNSEDLLRPGMSFRVAFELPGQSYPSIPEEAISWGADGAFVWAVRDGIAEQIPIALITRGNGRVLASAALSPGELIVTEGIQKVRAGARVDLVNGSQDGTARAQGAARATNNGAQ